MIIKPKNSEELILFLKSKPLILYGMGDTGIRISKWCEEQGVEYIFSDKNALSLHETTKKAVITPQSIIKEHPDANIVVSSIVYCNEITEDLIQMGVRKERIFPYSLFMPDEVSLKELEEAGLVNWERMQTRYEMIAAWGWIPKDIKTVVDYSAGQNFIMKAHLPSTVEYYPIDYADRGEGTIICDFNEDSFPKIYSELSACLAMVMYTKPASELIAHICDYTNHTVIFSAITIEGLPDIGIRRRSGMCQDLTEQQIVNMFSSHKFELKDKKYDFAGNSTMVFFLFENVGEIR